MNSVSGIIEEAEDEDEEESRAQTQLTSEKKKSSKALEVGKNAVAK